MRFNLEARRSPIAASATRMIDAGRYAPVMSKIKPLTIGPAAPPICLKKNNIPRTVGREVSPESSATNGEAMDKKPPWFA